MPEEHSSASSGTDLEKQGPDILPVTSQQDVPELSDKLEPVASIGASLHSTDTDPYGSRPACFSSTFQECMFVLTTTMAIGQSSIFIGAAICITSHIGAALENDRNRSHVDQCISIACIRMLLAVLRSCSRPVWPSPDLPLVNGSI